MILSWVAKFLFFGYLKRLRGLGPEDAWVMIHASSGPRPPKRFK